MAVKTVQHIWDGSAWVENYAKTSADVVLQTPNKKIMLAGERNLVKLLLGSAVENPTDPDTNPTGTYSFPEGQFNAPGKLLKVGDDGKLDLTEFDTIVQHLTVNDILDLSADLDVYGTSYFRGEVAIEDGTELLVNKIRSNNANFILDITAGNDINLNAQNKVFIGSMQYDQGSLIDISMENFYFEGFNFNISARLNANDGAVIKSYDGDNIMVLQNKIVSTQKSNVGVSSLFNNGSSGAKANYVTFDTGLKIAGNLKGVATPIESTDGVNKSYVDNLISTGTHSVAAVRLASYSTSTVSGNVATLSGVTVVIDGKTVAAGDRVLLKNQTTASQNGIYIVNTGAWTKVAMDSDPGSLAFVLDGTNNKGDQWHCSSTNTWVQFFSQDVYGIMTDGGLEIDATGLKFGIKTSGVTNNMLAGSIKAGKLLKSSTFSTTDDALTIIDGGITSDMLAGSISDGKLAAFTSSESVTPTASGSKTLSNHISQLLTAIKTLKGTTNWHTAPTQTMTQLQSNKNKSLYLASTDALPTSTAAAPLIKGDVAYKIVT